MAVIGISAHRLAAPFFILLFFLVLSGVLYAVFKRRSDCFYLVFPLLIAAGYLVMLSASRESALLRTLNEGERCACEISGTVRGVQKSQNGYKITLRKVSLCSRGEKLEDCILYTETAYERGARLRVKGTAVAFETAKNPGEFDTRRYYRTLGIGFKIYPDEVVIEEKNRFALQALSDGFSKKLHDSLYSVTDSASASVFAAMLLGERDELDPELSELFTVCGIGHILAISGLHVSLIGMGVYKALRKCGAGYTLAMVVGTAVILFYGRMTGNGTSTVRAVIMYITAVYANAAGRAYDMLSAASFAALIMLMGNPMFLYNCGFQLSFGAILGIVLIAEPVKQVFGIKNKILSAFVASLSVQAATMPVVMWNYYEIPVLSVFLNLIVLPLMTVVMVSAVFAGVVGIFSRTAGCFCIGPGALVLRLYRLLCAANLRIPWAVWICGKPELWQIAAYYLMLAVVIFALTKYGLKRFALGFVPALAALVFRLTDCFEADFLYVGQGDGIFIRSDNGVTFLVDGGSSDNGNMYEYTLEPFLMSKGVARLDYAIVTHCDADHINGLKALLEKGKIRVDAVYMPDVAADEAYEELWETAEKAGAQVRTISCGTRITAGSTALTCIHPRQGDGGADRNGASTVLVVENQDFSMLLTGDIGEEQEKMLCETVSEFAPFDVLKAAHHGSKYSNTLAFILAAEPENIVISCGQDNRYGHPHEDALKRMEEYGACLYRTDEQGAVVFGG